MLTSSAGIGSAAADVGHGSVLGHVPASTPGAAMRIGEVETPGSAPTAPPVAVCGNRSLLTGPSTPPAGAVTIPAGNDSALTPSHVLQPNTTYWLAPGVHTLGTGQFSQFQPDPGDLFLGGPGAVIDGQGLNQFAFTGDPAGAPNVTIEYLTIENFTSGQGEGVVNQGNQSGWVVEHNTIGPNEFEGPDPGGAGVMLATDSQVEYNCLSRNGEYGFSSFGGSSNITLSDNEISYNDALGGYDQPGSPISCGCSGGGKFWISSGVTVTHNYVHDNGNVGIWVDTDNTGVLLANNYVADNYAEGVIYEISYNGLIENNTFIGNAIGGGPEVAGFPDSAVYISESGFDPRVANPLHETAFRVSDNLFLNNWGGVVVWENSNRYCSDGSDAVCTLVDPSVYTLTSCAANLGERSPLNYYDNCRWRAQNVSVSQNLFSFEPSAVGSDCTVENFCGFNGLFSTYGEPPYGGPAVPINITFHQNSHFSDNTYLGPWNFEAWSQGNPDNPTHWTVWTAPVTDECSLPSENQSGTCDSGFGQDEGSTYNATGEVQPLLVSLSPSPDSLTTGQPLTLAAHVTGGAAPYAYTWSLDGANQTSAADSSNWTLAFEEPGHYVIRCWVEDAFGTTSVSSPAYANVTAPGPLPTSPGAGGGTGWIDGSIAVVAVAGVVAGVLVAVRLRRRPKVPAESAGGASDPDGPSP